MDANQENSLVVRSAGRSAAPARRSSSARSLTPFALPLTRRPKPAAHSAATDVEEAFSACDMERLYVRYLAARARNSERTDNVCRQTVEHAVRGMLPRLQRKHAGRKIDFDFVVVDGKVALKPIAK